MVWVFAAILLISLSVVEEIYKFVFFCVKRFFLLKASV